MNPVFPLIVAVINSLVPASQQAQTRRETEVEALARYDSIARDLAAVVFRDAETPLYDGPNGRAKTLATLVSIASLESSFRKDVDQGSTLGDGDTSYCLAQINLPGASRIVVHDDGSMSYSTTEGWSGRDLVADRKKCFRAALAIARKSFECPSRTPYDRLSMYASGRCGRGGEASANRVRRAETVMASLTLSDSEFESALKSTE